MHGEFFLPFSVSVSINANSWLQSQLDRRNAHNADPDPASPASTKPPSHTTHISISSTSNPRPTIPRRQLPPSATEGQQSAHNSGTSTNYTSALQMRRRQMQHPYELPPINTGAGIGLDATNIAAEIFGAASPASPVNLKPQRQGPKAELPISSQVNTPVEMADTHETSLEDRRELCQSPSWDAYSRRKKEKKEKEQAEKEAKAKKRRLSKAPPPSPSSSLPAPPKQVQQPNKAAPYPPSSRRGLAQAQTDACMSDSNLVRPRQQKERPASVLGLSSPDLPLPADIPAAQQARGRSSSISSLFRGRRSSVDQADSGFIGGIKLEQRRLEANQKELNEHAVASDDIEPPRRHADKRSPSPLRFFAPRTEPKDKNRSYPPIAIKTSGKSQGLLAPESPTTDDGMMNKWRTRMGLKEKKESREKGHRLTKTP